MNAWLSDTLEKSRYFMPHGHCYLWIPAILWMHVLSDLMIGIAYISISIILYVLVRRIRLPFSPVFVSFGLFIGLCGLTHFMNVWTVWYPDYVLDGLLKVATAIASVATAIGLLVVRPRVVEMVDAAQLSEERRIKLENAHTELEALYARVKQLDEIKTQFFANVSHELRTPLTLILGPAERMLGDADLAPPHRRQVETIVRNGQSLLKHVNDLLDVGKLEAGMMTPHYTWVDLGPWVRQVAVQFESAAEQRDIVFTVDAPTTLQACIDAGMVERVLINLLSNALRFTPSGGCITIGLAPAETGFAMSVTNTGPGINPDQQDLIFERFRQADGSATRGHGGTGLGLAIAREFVTLHGGRISVASVPGHGATFTAHLPLEAPVAAALVTANTLDKRVEIASSPAIRDTVLELAQEHADRTDPSRDGRTWVPGRPTVLLVEDNRDMRDFVAEVLGHAFNVTTAVDGQVGLEQILASPPDLLVTDLMMPRVSGHQLVAALRNRADMDAVPILLLTAKADDALRIHLLKSGVQDYLTKPFLPQELLARVSNLVAMKRAGDALRAALGNASGDIETLAAELASKHRQLQAALDLAEVAREHAERASRVKSTFLGVISHELRTPLSTIQMNAQLLVRAEGDIATPAISFPMQQRVERLGRAANQMALLIEGVLEYTRAESGVIDVQSRTVDLVALVADLVNLHAVNVIDDVALTLPRHRPVYRRS